MNLDSYSPDNNFGNIWIEVMSFEHVEVSAQELERILLRPATKWNEECRYLISIDENGCESVEYARKQFKECGKVDKLERYFTLTGIIFCREQYDWLMKKVMELKNKYWEGGFWVDSIGRRKRVVFHSHEIRKHTGPFSLLKGDEFESFVSDLTSLFISLRGRSCIISVTVDKQFGVMLYGDKMNNCYNHAVSLLLERFCFFLNRRSEMHGKDYKGMVVFESRGKDADESVREAIRKMIVLGNNYNRNRLFFDRIDSVGFLKKYSDDYQKSHFTIELADLVSYPIYKFVRDKMKNEPFIAIEPLLDNFPSYTSYGLKVFP